MKLCYETLALSSLNSPCHMFVFPIYLEHLLTISPLGLSQSTCQKVVSLHPDGSL